MIYLDHHAATPLAPGVQRAMEAAMSDGWGNASSQHAAGRAARGHVDRARRAWADAIGAAPADIVLTSGGTEACDLMIGGIAAPTRVITMRADHPAMRSACDAWAERGVEVVTLDPREGTVSVEQVQEHLIAGALLAAQWVNHETGTIAPVQGYARACRAAGATIVVDAMQALGRVAIDVGSFDIDALAMASHKIGGPCAGALWIHRRLSLQPRLRGGGQERGRRAGSQDAIVLAGVAAAAQAVRARVEGMDEVGRWRDRLQATLLALGATINGVEPRVASVVDASVAGWRGDLLVAALDVEGLCASTGAACSSGVAEPSAVLRALYPDEPWRAGSALRLSLGPEGLDDAAIARAEEILRRVLPRRAGKD